MMKMTFIIFPFLKEAFKYIVFFYWAQRMDKHRTITAHQEDGILLPTQKLLAVVLHCSTSSWSEPKSCCGT